MAYSRDKILELPTYELLQNSRSAKPISTKEDSKRLKFYMNNLMDEVSKYVKDNAFTGDDKSYWDYIMKHFKASPENAQYFDYDKGMNFEYHNNYLKPLPSIGRYSPDSDMVYVTPHLGGLEQAVNYKKDRRDQIRTAIRTLRHELSHREQYKEALDNAELPHREGLNLRGVNVTSRARDLIDPDRQLEKPGNDYEWIEDPEEWVAMADEEGYSSRIFPKHPVLSRFLVFIHNLIDKETDPVKIDYLKKVRANWERRAAESAERGEVEISDERVKVDPEEEKLLKAAEGYKGTNNIQQQLLSEAQSDGIVGQAAVQLVNRVMQRLNKTESGAQGNNLAAQHDPVQRWKNLALRLQSMRSY
jgi:hypothetical protein